MDYKIYDAHAHIFPDKIALKASDAIGDFYDYKMAYDGTVDGLLHKNGGSKINGFLVSSSATTPHQVTAVNDFVHAQCLEHKNFVGFGSMHPDFDNVEMELERINGMGLKGIKIHHDFLKADIDDEKSLRIYKKLSELDLFLLLHMGDDRFDHTHPKRLRHIKELFPDLKCIAAHFGGYRIWDQSVPYLKDCGVYFDTSSSLFALSPEKACEMLETLGYDRFFFGTDYPMWDLQGEIDRFMKLPLSEENRRKILSQNFERVFNVNF